MDNYLTEVYPKYLRQDYKKIKKLKSEKKDIELNELKKSIDNQYYIEKCFVDILRYRIFLFTDKKDEKYITHPDYKLIKHFVRYSIFNCGYYIWVSAFIKNGKLVIPLNEISNHETQYKIFSQSLMSFDKQQEFITIFTRIINILGGSLQKDPNGDYFIFPKRVCLVYVTLKKILNY